ncbi:hypothetical protein [Streptomyces sp.]|uniref:hypothetical protein n=1 Tax=Streptomyces sp. TaxID=1931 RepID=UPI002F9458FE
MSARTCVTNCGRPTRDTRLLCNHHVWEVEQALAELPALVDELSTTLTKQAKMGGGKREDKPTKGKVHPLPYDVRASEVLEQIRIVLMGWVMDLRDGSPAPIGPACEDCAHGSCTSIRWHALPADTLQSMSAWLLKRLDEIARHSAADDIWSEITDATAQGWIAVDRAATKTRFVVGPCPELSPTDGAACRGEVWAYIPSAEDQRARMACGECGTTWETHQWLRAGRRILDAKIRAQRATRMVRAIFGGAA